MTFNGVMAFILSYVIYTRLWKILLLLLLLLLLPTTIAYYQYVLLL